MEAGSEQQSPYSPGPGRGRRTSTLARPRRKERHTHTVVIDLDYFIDNLKTLPDPDNSTMTYSEEAIDLLSFAADESSDLGRAAKGAPRKAGWLGQLLHVPDELFGAAYDMIADHQESPMFLEDGRSSTKEALAERIMADHIMGLAFFETVYKLLRYAEPETSQTHGENLL